MSVTLSAIGTVHMTIIVTVDMIMAVMKSLTMTEYDSVTISSVIIRIVGWCACACVCLLVHTDICVICGRKVLF